MPLYFAAQYMEVLDKVKSAQSAADIEAVLSEPAYSDYVVVYMRLITSGYMQKNADFYVNFLDGHPTVKDFCALVCLEMTGVEGM